MLGEREVACTMVSERCARILNIMVNLAHLVNESEMNTSMVHVVSE